MLIDGLLPLLRRTGHGRVINVTSGGRYGQRVPDGDVESERDTYGPKKVYARTKRAQLIISEQWAARLRDGGVVVHAMHPGWADAKGVRTWMPVFRAASRAIIRSPDQGADTIVWLGASPAAASDTGELWHDRRTRPATYSLGAAPDTPAVRQQVWDHAAALAR